MSARLGDDFNARLRRANEAIARQVQAKIGEIRRLLKSNALRAAERQIALVAAAMPADDVARQLDVLRKQIDAIRLAEAVLAELTRGQQVMIEPEDITEVRRAARRAQAIDPDNEHAKKLLAEADRKAKLRAAELLRIAKAYKNFDAAKYRDKLTLAAALDPQGESGIEARRLLAE